MKHTAIVETLGQQGDGLVRIGNEQLHVPKVLQGETVSIINDRLVEVIAASPERQSPFCKHYDTCGGCKFQHWKDEPYALWKRQRLLDALKTHQIETTINPMIDAHGLGRRRVVFHVRQVDGIWQAGFMETKSHRLTALKTCPVLETPLQASPALAAAFGPILGPCDVAMTNTNTGIDVAVKAERQAATHRLTALQKLFTDGRFVRLSVNGESVFSLTKPEISFGKSTVSLPIGAFLQATAAGEETLSDLVRSSLRKAKCIADLFCGLGPFALRLAEGVTVHAVDADKDAVLALQEATRRAQGLRPVTTEVRDLFRNPMVSQELKNFDSVVLDPPRAGAEAQIKQLSKSRISRIAYVSCDVTTFARDAAILIQGGYRLSRVTPVDQFMWTSHLEMVGVFER